SAILMVITDDGKVGIMKDTYKIHTSYIIVILVAIIILLITVKWAAVPELVGYINFAATLASLLLAVVAILYAMYSNSSIAQNIGELDRAATDIRTAAIGIESTNAELHRRVNEIPPQIEHVNKSMDAIRAQLLDTTTHAGLLQERDSEMHTTSTEGNTDRCLRALLANLKKEEIRYLLHIDGDTKYLMELTSLY